MAKLMLVEDDNNLREIYEARLQAEGYTIVTAKDGEEALVVAKAEKPDLIIADVMMPKISGFEMLDILRNTDGLKEVKVIMLTALGQSDDQQQANRLGADRYLVKSQVTLEDIVKVTHGLLEEPATGTAEPDAANPAASEAEAPATLADPPPAEAKPTPVISVATPPAEPAAVTPAPAVTPAASDDAATATPPAATAVAAAPAPAASTPTNDESTAQSTVQEAAVEAKIEDFVTGATSEAPPPDAASPVVPTDTAEAGDETASPSPSAAAPSEPAAAAPAPTAPAAAPDTKASVAETDDKLLSQAADSLIADAAKSTSPPTKVAAVQLLTEPTQPAVAEVAPAATVPAVTPAPAAIPDPETKVIKPDVTAAPAAPESPDAVKKPSSNPGSVPIANKKVIKPLDTEPAKDIKTLLALEEAKQAAAQGPPPPTAIIATDEAGPAAIPLIEPTAPKISSASIAPSEEPPAAPATVTTSDGETIDPSSIAL